MARLSVKVTPNAKRSEIVNGEDTGEGGEVLRLKLKAPPVDGKANKELVAFLAKFFGVPKRAVAIVRGEKSRLKVVEIDGISDASFRARITST